MFRDGEQHVGLAHYAAGGEIILTTKNDLAFLALAIELGIHQAGAVTARGNQDVLLSEISVKIELAPDGQMPLARRHYDAIRKQRLLANAISHADGNVESEVQRAAGQLDFDFAPLDAQRGQGDLRRGFSQKIGQARQDDGFHQLPEAEQKSPPRMRGIEVAVFVEIDLEDLQRLANIVNHVAAEGRRDHVGAFADKKRVLQQLAQPLERVAHRRLGELQLPAGTGQVAFPVDGLKHHEQVEIDLAEMHGTNLTLFY